MNYHEALGFLMQRLPMFQRIGRAALKADLSNTQRLMEGLNNPERCFKSVHIAGTNGKGTSAHAIASVLQSAGYKTGLYTSPHLKSFTERIRIDGVKISEVDVASFVRDNQALIESINPSFFEVTVAMAFDHFEKAQVDIAVIETGLGGRLDSTNVIDPLVSLITMIDYDHAEILGDTLEKIASEKAGIIKPFRPVVIGADQPHLLQVFEEKASTVKAPLTTCNRYSVRTEESTSDSQSFTIHDKKSDQDISINTDVTATYFLKNIPGILATLAQLNLQGFAITEEAIKTGFMHLKRDTGLLGRWQQLSERPKVIADISHNKSGIHALMGQIDQCEFQKLHLIYGVVQDKEIDQILAMLPEGVQYYFTQSSVPRSMSADNLRLKASKYGLWGSAFANVNEAIDAAKKNAGTDDLIVVLGSTFVVAEIEDL